VRVAEQPKELRPGELGTALVLNVLGSDGQPALGREGLQLLPCAVVEALR
jgi:hypothetical protein